MPDVLNLGRGLNGEALVEDVFELSKRNNYGYHPRMARMIIVPERSYAHNSTRLYCHYDPTEFTEAYNIEWKIVPITLAGLAPPVFTQVEPRKWSMRLFFNELGESVSRKNPNTVSVDESITKLRGFALPSSYASFTNTGIGASSTASGEPPPKLLVFLISKVFRCIISEMSIVRKAIHPTERRTTRAEIDVTFLEYTESAG